MVGKKRVFLVVLDSVGIGELPDASEFGDEGAHTLGNIHRDRPLKIPNLLQMGLGHIENARLDKGDTLIGAYGRMMTKTKAKDTTSGHWEMMGIVMDPAFSTYTENGFPAALIQAFEEKIGMKTMVNKAYSGTELIRDFGREHMKTGYPMVYTSADSVFQIAAHEEIISLERLYELCEIAYELTKSYQIGRIIARPFTGLDGNFKRTENRKDFAVPPVQATVLDALKAAGKEVYGVGKIEDIFSHQGLTGSNHTTSNKAGIKALLSLMDDFREGLVFVNLVDFDMLYGHRNDVSGYGDALEYFDQALPDIWKKMKENDLLIITADHGCDPTTKSTDHSREYVPVLMYGAPIQGREIGTRRSLADLGASIYDYFDLGAFPVGQSFLKKIRK